VEAVVGGADDIDVDAEYFASEETMIAACIDEVRRKSRAMWIGGIDEMVRLFDQIAPRSPSEKTDNSTQGEDHAQTD
jgi:hypothetical protein